MLQGFHEQWKESEKNDWESEQEDGTVVEGGEESEAKSVGEEGDMKKEGNDSEEEHERVEKKVNENVMGNDEIVAVDDASMEETLNNRETDATEDSPTATIHDEIQKEAMTKTAVVCGGEDNNGDNKPHQETTAYSIQGIDEEESSLVRDTPEGSEESPPEIILDMKHPADITAARHQEVEGEDVHAQIAESNANADSLDDATSTSESIEHQEITSDVVDPIDFEREYTTAKGAGDPMRNDSSISSSIDEVKSVRNASDVINIDPLLTTAPSVKSGQPDKEIINTTSSTGLGDRDDEGELGSIHHRSDTKMEDIASTEPPMKQMENASLSQATDETAKNYSKPKDDAAFTITETATNDIKPEKVISMSKEDSKAGTGRGLIEHEEITPTGKDGKESRGMEKSSSELYAMLSRRFPHASCMKDLEFQSFKSKTLPVHAGSGGSVGAGAKMEPIFTKITSEIKSVQITQHQYEHYISALKACYEAMFLDMVKDLDYIQASLDQRLSSLEQADFASLMRTKTHSNPSSFDRLSVFTSSLTAMVYRVASTPTIQEHSNVLCAASLAICLLLLWRAVRRNMVRGPGEKRIGDDADKDNEESTPVQLTSHSYNSNPQKKDRKHITKLTYRIPELIAENNLPPELIAENNLLPKLIAENNLLKKELMEVKCKLTDLQHEWHRNTYSVRRRRFTN